MQGLGSHLVKLGAVAVVSLVMGGWAVAGAEAASASPPSQGPGHSAAALGCQQGGWMTLEGANGNLFTTVGACVTYAASGGTLVPIPPSVSVSFSPAGSSTFFCEVHLTVARFQPTTHYTVTYSLQETGGGSVFGPLTYGPGITTDTSGDFSGTVFSILNATNAISFTVGSVTTPFVAITC